jgi:hypothetical protein
MREAACERARGARFALAPFLRRSVGGDWTRSSRIEGGYVIQSLVDRKTADRSKSARGQLTARRTLCARCVWCESRPQTTGLPCESSVRLALRSLSASLTSPMCCCAPQQPPDTPRHHLSLRLREPSSHDTGWPQRHEADPASADAE